MLKVEYSACAGFCSSPRMIQPAGSSSTLLLPKDTTILADMSAANANATVYLPRISLAAGMLTVIALITANADTSKKLVIVPATVDSTIKFYDTFSSAYLTSIVLGEALENVTLFCSGRDWIVVRRGWPIA
jgi:hypothetical protein